jgi:hypothetical protein
MNCIYLSAVLISQRATTQIQSGVPDRISIPLSGTAFLQPKILSANDSKENGLERQLQSWLAMGRLLAEGSSIDASLK